MMFTLVLTMLGTSAGTAQPRQQKMPSRLVSLLPVKTQVSVEIYLGKSSVRVVDSSLSSGPEVAHAKIKKLRFHNGTIELGLAGKPLGAAPAGLWTSPSA